MRERSLPSTWWTSLEIWWKTYGSVCRPRSIPFSTKTNTNMQSGSGPTTPTIQFHNLLGARYLICEILLPEFSVRQNQTKKGPKCPQNLSYTGHEFRLPPEIPADRRRFPPANDIRDLYSWTDRGHRTLHAARTPYFCSRRPDSS